MLIKNLKTPIALLLSFLMSLLYTIITEIFLYYSNSISYDKKVSFLIFLYTVTIILMLRINYWYMIFLNFLVCLVFCIPIYLIMTSIKINEYDPGMFVYFFYVNGFTLFSNLSGSLLGFFSLGIIKLINNMNKRKNYL